MQWRDATVSETDATGFEASGSVAARQEPDVRQVFDQVGIVAVAGFGDRAPGRTGSSVHGGPGTVLRRVSRRRGDGQGDVPGMRGQAGLPDRCARAQGALGCLGRRAADARRDRAAQAPPRTSAQDRSGRLRITTGPAPASRRPRGGHEPRGRVPHTMHTQRSGQTWTELLARERTRDNLEEAEQLRYSRRLRRSAGPRARAPRRAPDGRGLAPHRGTPQRPGIRRLLRDRGSPLCPWGLPRFVAGPRGSRIPAVPAAQARPYTGMAAPEMRTASSETRKARTAASSDGLGHRSWSARGIAARLAGVSMMLGMMQLTRTPSSRPSAAAASTRRSTPSLLTL